MLHPVGDLPASVYWRRRLVVLAVLVGLLAGASWLVLSLVARAGPSTAGGSATTSSSPAPTPALERVLPSLAGVRTPDLGPATPRADPRPTPTPAATSTASEPAGQCADDVTEVSVRAPAQVAAGSKPTLEIAVRNTGTVPCARSVDQELQEILLLDADGTRVWGSNDCFPEQSDRTVTLQPGEEVGLPIVWGGRTSAPGCAGERTVPPAGDYLLRARLDTKASADVPLELV